ncbi:nucleoporin NDC1 [Athalia rosae]|uniref:nucleoporin NDC1 n=1 Tax=Athalia rosae TaxID=37344 RepID=UPI002033501A|nr:nucleoporin NDC1 [Athalia rosae]
MTGELSSLLGCKELLMWRMFMAILTSICAQFLIMSSVILIINFRIMHPLSWIANTWDAVTCIRTWGYFLILATVIFLQGVICSKFYLHAPVYRKSRFTILRNIFKPHNLPAGALHVLAGGVLTWLHLSLRDGHYNSLTIKCNAEDTCLIEENFFLMLSGLWIGLYSFIKSHFSNIYIQFPIIPRSKFSQIKSGIWSLLPQAMLNAVSPILCFVFFYYFNGGYYRENILLIFSIKMKDAPLNTVYGLLNISLIFYAWLFASVFILTMNTMHLSFQAYLTQRVDFDIEQQNMYANQISEMTLADALAIDRIPIVQHLAYFDLVTLAQKEKSKRSILFTLSSPGCRPCNWNGIAIKCIGLLTNFTIELNRACAISQKPTSSPATLCTPGKMSDNFFQYRMRNLTTAKLLGSTMDSSVPPRQTSSEDQMVGSFFKSKRDQFVTYLFSKQIIKYLFEESLEEKVRYIFTNAQPVIWAAESISSLIVISLTEDQYGVIQQDLPTIISTLLTLKEALDKLQKANIFVKRTQSDDKEMRQMVTCLRSATKRSIYRITTTFRDYMKDLLLEPDTMSQLQSFMSYRE